MPCAFTPRVTTPRPTTPPLTEEPVVTPPSKSNHSPPILDLPSTDDSASEVAISLEYHRRRPHTTKVSEATDLSDDNIVFQASSILPMLVTNFEKIHASIALMLARLETIDHDNALARATTVTQSDRNTNFGNDPYSERPSDHPIDRRNRRKTTIPKKMSCVSGKSSGNISNFPTPSSSIWAITGSGFGDGGFKTCPTTTSSMDSLPEIPHYYTSRCESSTAVIKMSTMISNRAGMEKWNRVIQGHSKHLQRKTSSAFVVWEFLENRTSSSWAYYYGSYFAPFFLIVSVFTTFLQSVDDWAMPEQIFSIMQTAFELWFAGEITIRFAVCPNRAEFWLSAFNLIDSISVAPLFLRIYTWIAGIGHNHFMSVFALVPILRLLKILRRFHKFQLLVSAFAIAVEALPVLLFSLMLIAVVFSGLMFVIESRELLPDLPRALWFVIVTMTTVGYGDITPETRIGQAITAFLMILSALYMALPIGIVGNAFSEVWKDRDRLLLLAVLRESFAISGISRPLIREMFTQFAESSIKTENGDPEMALSDFEDMITALQIDVTRDRIVNLFEAIDEDGSGYISCDEFIHRLFPLQFRQTRISSQF